MKFELPSRGTITSMSGVTAEKDLPVLASAIACGAEYLIKGDRKDFYRLKGSKEYNIKIVGPSEFIESVFPEILKEA